MLLDKLSELLKYTQQLSDLLEQERQCLKEKSFDNLNTLLMQKKSLLQAINDTNQQVSTEENLQLIIESDQLSSKKNEIEFHLQTCHKNNNINGQLIAMSMKSNKHLMQLLTLAKGQNSVTYDQEGALNRASLLGDNIEA